MDKVLLAFQDIFRRIFGPATVFFIVLLVEHLLWVWCTESLTAAGSRLQAIRQFLAGSESPKVAGFPTTWGLAILIGTGYFLKPFNDYFFDFWLKKDFSPWFFNKSPIDKLREGVIKRLKDLYDLKPTIKDITKVGDYQLYEILGGIDQMPTRTFVDDAKTVGYFFTSVALVSLGHLPFSRGCDIIPMSALAGAAWFLGYAAVRTYYRDRAIRLYVNFLMMPLPKIRGILLDYKKQGDKQNEGAGAAS